MAKIDKGMLVLQAQPVRVAVLQALDGGGEQVAATFRQRLFKLFADNSQAVVACALDAKAQGIPVKIDGIRNNDYARLEEARALFKAYSLPRARAEVEAFVGGWGKLVAFSRSVVASVSDDIAHGKAEQAAMAAVLAETGHTLADVLAMPADKQAEIADKVEAVKTATANDKQDKIDSAKEAREQPAKAAARFVASHGNKGTEWLANVGREIVKQAAALHAAAGAEANAAKVDGDNKAAADVKAEYAKAANIKAAA